MTIVIQPIRPDLTAFPLQAAEEVPNTDGSSFIQDEIHYMLGPGGQDGVGPLPRLTELLAFNPVTLLG